MYFGAARQRRPFRRRFSGSLSSRARNARIILTTASAVAAASVIDSFLRGADLWFRSPNSKRASPPYSKHDTHIHVVENDGRVAITS
jgi:hypothetical protein